MSPTSRGTIYLATLVVLAGTTLAQSSYQVVSLSNPGRITGTVKWSGLTPHTPTLSISKDPEVCDPDSHKVRDLERLIIGPENGVANTVVFLKDVSRGKAFNFSAERALLNQKHCRYEPHILLVPQSAVLQMKSSDPVLHTVHMDGVASYNLPFPFPNQITPRNMPTAGLVNLRCNGGHIWMNAELFVAAHPYYAVTDETGNFELTDVPPGNYQIVAWHEGWKVVRQVAAYDVLTEQRVPHLTFNDPRTWEKNVTVNQGGTSVISFLISDK